MLANVVFMVDPVPSNSEGVTVHQQTVSPEETSTLSEGVSVSDSNISSEGRKQLKAFLTQWKDIFSKDLTDQGNYDMVKDKIRLTIMFL